MLCTFCGTDNRPESKFCGMCGVGLERRKVERRFTSHQASRRCPFCNHVNETGYKFCAMCGSRVENRGVERRTDKPRAVATANAQLPGPEGPQVAVSEPDPIENTHPLPTTIRGPSFLGLSDDTGYGDYLLDEDGSSGSVLRSLVLVAVLAALGGLVYLQWQAGFPVYYAISDRVTTWAKAELGSLAQHEQKSETQKSEAMVPEQTNTQSRTIELKKDPSAPNDAASAVKNKPPADGLKKDLSTPNDRASAAKNKPPADELNKDSSAPNDTASTAKNNPPADLVPVDDATHTPATPVTEAKASVGEAATPLKAKAKSAKTGQESPSALLLRAQQYLQGTGGVSENCPQALVYLRAAAKSEAAAAMQLGALYASGHCVRTDRVQAYRWLNSAHELQPGNANIQTRMNELWALMTVQERGQIVR